MIKLAVVLLVVAAIQAGIFIHAHEWGWLGFVTTVMALVAEELKIMLNRRQ